MDQFFENLLGRWQKRDRPVITHFILVLAFVNWYNFGYFHTFWNKSGFERFIYNYT